MSSYLTQLLVEGHTADLRDQARRARLARASREAGQRPSRLRTLTARLLVALATRLDDRPWPTAVPASISGAGR